MLKFLSEGLPTSLSETLIFSPKSYPKYHHNIRVATVEATETLVSVYLTNALNFDATVVN